ncbi:MAG: hypothetical protein HY556_06290 [Euryarchaeota archaeon]|nr:hypothetical protein [Euryarchaeota archaeon]
MELKVIERTDKAIEFELPGENETLLNLLKQKLLENDKIVTATYIIGHPLLDKPRLFVEARSGKAETHVKAAVKALREDLDSLEDAVLKFKK